MEVINPRESGEFIRTNKLRQPIIMDNPNINALKLSHHNTEQNQRIAQLEEENNSLRSENLYLKNRIAQLEHDLRKYSVPVIDLWA